MLTLQPLVHLIWNVASFAGFVAAVVYTMRRFQDPYRWLTWIVLTSFWSVNGVGIPAYAIVVLYMHLNVPKRPVERAAGEAELPAEQT